MSKIYVAQSGLQQTNRSIVEINLVLFDMLTGICKNFRNP